MMQKELRTVMNLIKLLLKEQSSSDQVLHCLPRPLSRNLENLSIFFITISMKLMHHFFFSNEMVSFIDQLHERVNIM